MTSLPDKNKKKLIIVDGNHLVHRAFYAIRAPLKTSAGEPTNAIYGFASMILNILERDEPDYFIVTFDEHGPTFRHEMHDGYKGTRTKAPDELYAQIPRIKEMLTAFNVDVFSKPQYEADDVMGTLARRAEKMDIESYLVSGDMDLLQLVSDHIFVAFPHKGYKEPIIYDAERVYKKYHIHPDQVTDYKALVGDSSDNIKGVPGIGPKGACKMLADYQHLDNIYEHLDELPAGLRDKMLSGQEDAYFSKSLATIMTDIPIEFKLDSAAIELLDFGGLFRFFDRMEMKSLQNRLRKTIPEDRLADKAQLSLF